MANQTKRGFTFARFGKRDSQVTPVDDDGRTVQGQVAGREKNAHPLNTVSQQVDDKKTERENKRIKKEEMDRMKIIQMEHRLLKRRLRKEVRKDLADTSLETCATFCFILIVGSTLLGGGAALIVSGRENNVFDFIVVGASGITIGVIFTVAGMILILKPVYEKHQARKQAERGEFKMWGRDNAQDRNQKSTYLDETRKNILTSEIGDPRIQQRRPSNVELYGDESFDNAVIEATPRDQSFHSYEEPPLLAVPNNEKQSSKNKPVLLLLDAKEEPASPSPVNDSAQHITTTDSSGGLLTQPVKHAIQQNSSGISELTRKAENPNPENNYTRTRSQTEDIDIKTISKCHRARNVSKSTIVIEHFVSDDFDQELVPNETSDPKHAQSHEMKELENTHGAHSISSGVTVPLNDSLSDLLQFSDSPRYDHNRDTDV